MTHTDPKAEYGAFTIALATQMICQNRAVSGEEFLQALNSTIGNEAPELIDLLQKSLDSARNGDSPMDFAHQLGLTKGVSGYVYHSVPVAFQAWFRYPHDFKQAIVRVVECGGDTDSVAAIVGGLVGTAVGEAGIPLEWQQDLIEFPRSLFWMKSLGLQLSECLSTRQPKRPMGLPIVPLLLRNLVFLAIVLGHGFRRLLPPY